MPFFGKKPSRKKQLKGAFDIPLNTTARDRAAMAREAAKDRAIAVVAREKKKSAERQAAVERAEKLKAAGLARREKAKKEAKAARQKAEAQQKAVNAQRTACTCRKPQLDGSGQCRRCHKKPASRRRR